MATSPSTAKTISDAVVNMLPAAKAASKRYKCNDCELAFRRAEHLSRHVLTHSGDKPFPCGVCSRGFSRVDALRRHARIHGPQNSRAHFGGQAGDEGESYGQSIGNSERWQQESIGPQKYAGALPAVTIPRIKPFSEGIARPSDRDNTSTIRRERTTGGICPTQLRHLASTIVLLVRNGDRTMYQCPIKGCKSLITGHHLSFHLEFRRKGDKAHSQIPIHTNSIPSPHHPAECLTLGRKDLISFIDHIFERHSISSCRDCGTSHDRAEYYSVENAPCTVHTCNPDASGTDDEGLADSAVERPNTVKQTTLGAVLAGSLTLTVFQYTRTASTAESTWQSVDRNKVDPLAILAGCATDELKRFTSASSTMTPMRSWSLAPSPTPLHRPPQSSFSAAPSLAMATAAESHRFRIQDLLN